MVVSREAAFTPEDHTNGHEAREPSVPLTVFLKDEIARRSDVVGGKGAGLAELKAIPGISEKVPDGFVIPTSVYKQILAQNPQIAAQIEELDRDSVSWISAKLTNDEETVRKWEKRIASSGTDLKEKLGRIRLLPELENTISQSYVRLCEMVGEEDADVAVRSSGAQEDGADKSFAGQNATFLNQRGKDAVIKSVKNCIASQFEERAIVYRNNERLRISEKGLKEGMRSLSEALDVSKAFSHSESRLAVVIQKMVRSLASGVALSIDPTTGAPRINIELNNGIGESVVGGEATPDFFEVDEYNPKNILGRRLGAKGAKTTYSGDGGTETVGNSADGGNKFAVTDEQVREIAKDICLIKTGLNKEVDTEFALDEKGKLWWVQARPETVGSKRDPHVVGMKEYRIPEGIAQKAEVILEGGIVGSPGCSTGTKLIADTAEEAMRIIEFPENKGKTWILVTDMTTPDWVPVMKKVKGIITRHGGRTCHAAIVSRELGVPALVGTEKAIEALIIDDSITEITLDVGNRKVYKRELPLAEVGEDIDAREILRSPTDTVVGINMSMPDEAKKLHALAELGDKFKISLLRIEFLLRDIGVHANALIDFDKGILKPDLHKKIAEKIAEAGYTSGKEYFVAKLSEGIASIAANFPNSKITLRTTDFKTNEYEGLIGGEEYEEVENNPMIGWRGLVRSLCPESREAFKLELLAIKKARDSGYKNIEIMFPVVRDPLELNGSPEEMEKWYGKGFRSAYDIMTEVGLIRGRDGLRTLIMVEDETNVERLPDYIDAGIDGISIGSNDLTQLVLGVDRDNSRLQKIPRYSEMNPAVIDKIRRVIEICRGRGIETGICGDGPSSNPEMARILVETEIDSIGVTPDRFLATYRLVKKVEEEQRQNSQAAVTAPTVLFSP